MFVEEEIIMSLELKRIEQESHKKRCIISWITILCILFCIMIALPKFAYAADTVDDSTPKGKMDDFLQLDSVAHDYAEILQYLQDGVFIKISVEQFFSGDVVKKIIDNLEGLDFVLGLETALKGIAMFIIMYHLILSMVKELERGEMTMESWLRILIAFVIPCVCIMEYDRVMKAIGNLGIWLQDSLNHNATINLATTEVPEDLGVSPAKWDGWRKIGDYLSGTLTYMWAYVKGTILFIPYAIVNFLIILAILNGVMSNYIEVVLRHLFLPFAIANISYEGVRSSGLRYIKKYLGCFIKIGCIMVIVDVVLYVYLQLKTLESSSAFHKTMFFVLLYPVTKQALQMGNEIITDAIGD